MLQCEIFFILKIKKNSSISSVNLIQMLELNGLIDLVVRVDCTTIADFVFPMAVIGLYATVLMKAVLDATSHVSVALQRNAEKYVAVIVHSPMRWFRTKENVWDDINDVNIG